MEYRRRILLNTPHLETVSGSVAHFSTDMASKLKECKVNFLPQQAGSGDPSPDNVRSISGWTGCDVVHSGKNIVDIIGYSASSPNSKTGTRSLTNNYGTTISTTDFSLPDSSVVITQSQCDDSEYKHHYKNGFVAVVVDNLVFEQYYNVSFRVTNITSNLLNASLSDMALANPRGSYKLNPEINGDRLCYKNVIFSRHQNNPNRSTFVIELCGMSFTLSEFMVTPVEDEDYTYAPYDPDKITVSWQDSGTIYGGYIDVLRGELVQEWAKIQFKDISFSYNSEYKRFSGGVDLFTGITTRTSPMICDSYITGSGTGSEGTHVDDDNMVYFYGLSNGSTNRLHVKDSRYTEPSDLIANMGETTVVYKLDTPITYPLTPEIIKAIKGINNIWSDANGDVEVKFWTH